MINIIDNMTAPILRFTLFLFLIFISINFAQSDVNQPQPGELYKSFTENGIWSWFSDPRGIYYEGEHSRTYAGWIDNSGNIVVGFYDHDTKETGKNILQFNFEVDDHNNPSLVIDKEGKLMVFYSKHTSLEPILLSKAKYPEYIYLWEPAKNLYLNDTTSHPGLSHTYTYTNVYNLSDENKLYLFWRGIDFKPNISASTDNGKNWSKGKILILPENNYANKRPYLKIASNDKDVIHFAFTDGHPRVEKTNSIYYAKYKNGNLYKANGDKILAWNDIPFSPSQTDIVYDATETNEKAWVWDVAENDEGNPVIVYVRFPDDSNHVYYYAIWNNDKWNNYKVVNSGKWFPETPEGKTEPEPNYSGGITLDQNDPSTVYLSRQINGIFEIEKWTTNNKGKDWQVEKVTENSQNNNVRPFVIRNYSKGNQFNLLWLNIKKYIDYRNYNSSIKMNLLK